jgi:16S rRNA (guanine527-N7)-methyltransferase
VTRSVPTPTRAPLPLPETSPLTPPESFASRLAALGVDIDANAVVRLGDFLARLLAMNEQCNLTAITDPVEAWTRHGLDALSLVPLLADLPAGARVLDMGSGGGVPGIPLAITRPDLRFTLVDATAKKTAFLVAVAEALRLDNVTVINARAEELASGELQRSFDVVTARAVAKLAALLPWTAPFAKARGRLLLIKGERADQELADAAKALRRFRCTHERTVQTPTGRLIVLRAD